MATFLELPLLKFCQALLFSMTPLQSDLFTLPPLIHTHLPQYFLISRDVIRFYIFRIIIWLMFILVLLLLLILFIIDLCPWQ